MGYDITTSIDIDAGPQAVWDVLIDFPRYGEWSNFSSAEGTPLVGSRLAMRMPGFTFRPRVSAVEPGRKLQWVGTLLSGRIFHGAHSFILTPQPDGTTRVTNHEEFSGVLVTLMQRFVKRSESNGYTAFNAGLKRQVESR